MTGAPLPIYNKTSPKRGERGASKQNRQRGTARQLSHTKQPTKRYKRRQVSDPATKLKEKQKQPSTEKSKADKKTACAG